MKNEKIYNKNISNTQKDRKNKIVLAAVLKPIHDTRMYEKLGTALANIFNEVHIIGTDDTESYQNQSDVLSKNIKPKNITFHPLFSFKRTSILRMLAGWNFLKKIWTIQPDVIVIEAIELLPAAGLYKLFYPTTSFVYDIRENYVYNIIYQDVYPFMFKHILAFIVRGIEKGSLLFTDKIILAERCYWEEMPFLKAQKKVKVYVVENKFKAIQASQSQKRDTKDFLGKKNLRFLLTGTISEVFGVYQAIELMKKILAHSDSVFTVCGKITDEKISILLHELLATYPEQVILKTDRKPVSHQIIIEELLHTDVALLPYIANKSTEKCIPTKMYECLSLAIPMLIQNNKYWEEICNPHQAAVFIDYPLATAPEIINQITTKKFYPNGSVASAKWQDELIEEMFIF
jgi:hypothetical protein